MFFLLSFQVADSRWESTCGADARWNPHLNWKMKFDPKRTPPTIANENCW
jgi:hypothetical protein